MEKISLFFDDSQSMSRPGLLSQAVSIRRDTEISLCLAGSITSSILCPPLPYLVSFVPFCIRAMVYGNIFPMEDSGYILRTSYVVDINFLG